MSVSRSRRSTRSSLLLPLALAATAAAASAALWYFLNDDEDYTPEHEHGDRRGERNLSRRARRQSHDRITELDEESSDDRVRSFKPPQPTYDPSRKRSIAIVVSELHRPETNLLHQLPTPLDLARHNVFVLIYSPQIPAHPLATEDARGTIYNQARSLFPPDYPPEFVLPFSEQPSVVSLLKQLEPDTVYIEEDLVGDEGELVAQVMQGGWVGSVVVTLEDDRRADRLDQVRQRFGKKCKVLSMGDVGEDWMQRVG